MSDRMAVQEYLATHTLKELQEDLAIKATAHKRLPLVVLNYDQIKSPKYDPIVRECRGLVLDTRNWSPVARGFKRFYNWGEDPEGMAAFDWSTCTATAKEDGSFIQLFRFEGEWILSTRGTFGDGLVHGCAMTFEQLFCAALGVGNLQDIQHPDVGMTFIFELCSGFNKVVRQYEATTAYPIGVLEQGCELGIDGWHWSQYYLDRYGVILPQRYAFASPDDVAGFLQRKSAKDPTFEGVVIKDARGIRFKCKTSTDVALHHLKGNNGSGFTLRNLVPLVLAGEEDEAISVFPEAREIVERVRGRVQMEWELLQRAWRDACDYKEQKDFAIAVTTCSKLAPLLFHLRKHGGDLRELWLSSADAIIKALEKEDRS